MLPPTSSTVQAFELFDLPLRGGLGTKHFGGVAVRKRQRREHIVPGLALPASSLGMW